MKEQSKRLGIEPIHKILPTLAVPATVGMLVMALHSVIDMIYIARGVGTVGVAAITISFPHNMILMALNAAIGIGGGSFISRALGAKQIDQANRALGNIISMILAIGVTAAILGLTLLEPMLKLFGASEAIMPYAAQYLGIILYGTIFFSFFFTMNNLVRAEGNASLAMSTMIISSVLNIILTPFFLFTLDMGIKGAAYGTILSQSITAVYLFYYYYSGKSTLSLNSSYMGIDFSIIKNILSIGLSAFIRQGSGSVMLIIANNLLVFYGGDIAVAALGIIHRVMMFTLMPILGVVQGMLPLVGFNHGANQPKRVSETIVLAMKIATALSCFAFFLVMIAPGMIFKIFTIDQQLINLGIPALRIMFALSFTIGLQMISGGVFQAIGKAKAAIVLSLSRTVLFLIPAMLVLPLFLDLQGIWLAFPVADLFSVILSLWLIKRYKEYFFNNTGKLKDKPTG